MKRSSQHLAPTTEAETWVRAVGRVIGTLHLYVLSPSNREEQMRVLALLHACYMCA